MQASELYLFHQSFLKEVSKVPLVSLRIYCLFPTSTVSPSIRVQFGLSYFQFWCLVFSFLPLIIHLSRVSKYLWGPARLFGLEKASKYINWIIISADVTYQLFEKCSRDLYAKKWWIFALNYPVFDPITLNLCKRQACFLWLRIFARPFQL